MPKSPSNRTRRTESQWTEILREFESSRRDAREVVLREGRARSWTAEGGIALLAHDFDPARSAYTRALAAVPGDPAARFGIAALEFRMGRREVAQRELEDLVAYLYGLTSDQ